MALSKKLTRDEQKAIALENQKAKEKIHDLVVKIISWKSGLHEGASVSSDNKISPREWSSYKSHILSISKLDSESKVKDKLQEIYTAIKNHGGFK